MMEQTQQTPFYGSTEGSDPNDHINADQLAQGDRGHVLQILGNLDHRPEKARTVVPVLCDGGGGGSRTRVRRTRPSSVYVHSL